MEKEEIVVGQMVVKIRGRYKGQRGEIIAVFPTSFNVEYLTLKIEKSCDPRDFEKVKKERHELREKADSWLNLAEAYCRVGLFKEARQVLTKKTRRLHLAPEGKEEYKNIMNWVKEGLEAREP